VAGVGFWPMRAKDFAGKRCQKLSQERRRYADIASQQQMTATNAGC
jgi:hypothetical protein